MARLSSNDDGGAYGSGVRLEVEGREGGGGSVGMVEVKRKGLGGGDPAGVEYAEASLSGGNSPWGADEDWSAARIETDDKGSGNWNVKVNEQDLETIL